jgi:hypothetical protein
LLKADVIVQCGNRTTRLARSRHSEKFAIGEEHSTLALVDSRVMSRTATSAMPPQHLVDAQHIA